MKCKLIFFCFLMVFFSLNFVCAAQDEWWDTGWHERFIIEVNASDYTRTNWTVEVFVNFTEELSFVGSSGIFDSNSVRVIEYNSTGSVLFELPSQFEHLAGYDADGNAVGNVVFVLNGTTSENSVRNFYVYFDTLNYTKSVGNYSSELNYVWDGEKFFINNSVLELKVGTLLGENTSGLYYAKRLDVDKAIFDESLSEKSVEYIQYYNGSSEFGFDFANNASLILNGSVKMVVSQVGDEVLWNTGTATGIGRMFKEYTIYRDSPWIKIKQTFQNLAGVSVDRSSNGLTALALDVERALGIVDSFDSDTTDPFSWSSGYRVSTATGLGVININETETTNYFAIDGPFTGKIGIQLSSTTVGAGGNISETAVVYFNDQASHVSVEDLKNRLANPVVVSKNDSEGYTVSVITATDYDYYNLNDSIWINASVTVDDYNLTKYINATLDNGTVTTSDDIICILYDDGLHSDGVLGDGIYGNGCKIDIYGTVGNWTITSTAYGDDFQQITNSTKTISVTDRFYSKLSISNAFGLVSRVVYAIFSLFNFRQDSPITGANVTCYYNSTEITDIVDLDNGNYSMNFTAPGVFGDYYLVCNGTDSVNNGSDFEWFYTEPETTQINLSFVPESENVYGVSQSDNQSFVLNVTLENIGQGTAAAADIILVMPNGNFSANSTLQECGTILVDENCTKSFLILILEGTVPGDYNVTINSTWTNPDGSTNYTNGELQVNVVSNPVLDISEAEINFTVAEGTNVSVGNFTLNATGNDEVTSINYSCVGGNVCQNFSLSFSQESVSSINAGEEVEIEVYVSVPEGFDFGNYSGVVNVSSANGGNESFSLNIEVPVSRTWDLVPNNFTSAVLIDSEGDLCSVIVDNTGNMPLNFSVGSGSMNYTTLNQANFSLQKQQNLSFCVQYNTSGASQGNYNSFYDVNASPGAVPSSSQLIISLDVVFGPDITSLVVSESEQAGVLSILANVSDRSGAGLAWVRANITKPDLSISSVNLSNITAAFNGGSSLWEYTYSDTSQRGTYQIVFYSLDFSGGSGGESDSVIVYAKLNITLDTGWDDYLLGESGSIYYNITDSVGEPLIAEVNFSLYDSDDNLRYFSNYTTDSDGKLDIIPTFEIPNDAPMGYYSLISHTISNDTLSGIVVNKSMNLTLGVYSYLFVNLDTTVVWYPDSTMIFYLLVYSTGEMNGDPTSVNLTIYDPAQAVYTSATIGDMSVVQQNDNSILYMYQYAMPISSAAGNYLAVVGVNEGSRTFNDVHSFRVSSGGPYDLILDITDSEVERSSDVPFNITMKNIGDFSQDVFLDYWVRDLNNNTYSQVTGEAIYVAAGNNVTISRELNIMSSQISGTYEVVVKMVYSKIQEPIITSRTFSVVDGDPGEQPEEPSPGGGGGASGSGTSGSGIFEEELDKLIVVDIDPDELQFEKLIVVDIDPDELNIERGGENYVIVKLKNNKNVDVTNIYADVVLNGYSNFTKVDKIAFLRAGEEGILPIRVKLPFGFLNGNYVGTLKVFSDQGDLEMEYVVNVFDSKKELIEHRIISLKSKLDILKVRITQAKRDGLDVEDVSLVVGEISVAMDSVEENFKSKNYFVVLKYLDDVEDKIEEGNYLLDIKIPPGVRVVFTSGTQVLLIFVIIVILGGIIFLGMIFKKHMFRNRIEYLKNKSLSHYWRVGEKKIERKKIEDEKVVEPVVEKVVEKVVEEKSNEHLKTLNEQYTHGYISKETYEELKENFLK
jgi:uncharacterized membrane protein